MVQRPCRISGDGNVIAHPGAILLYYRVIGHSEPMDSLARFIGSTRQGVSTATVVTTFSVGTSKVGMCHDPATAISRRTASWLDRLVFPSCPTNVDIAENPSWGTATVLSWGNCRLRSSGTLAHRRMSGARFVGNTNRPKASRRPVEESTKEWKSKLRLQRRQQRSLLEMSQPR